MSPERLRDSLGRPLPVGASPDLVVPGVPVREVLSDEDAWTEGIEYLDAGRPFHAHEVFELRWRLAPAQERDAWQALAQWGAALTHEARGNPTGAIRVAARAVATLDGAEHVPSCIDTARVRASCLRLIQNA